MENEYQKAAFLALTQVIESERSAPPEAEANRIMIELQEKGFHIVPIEDRVCDLRTRKRHIVLHKPKNLLCTGVLNASA